VRLADTEVRALGEGYATVHDDWLGPDLALAVYRDVEAVAAAGRLHPAGVSRGAGHRLDAETRGDAIAWLAPETASPALGALLARFEALRAALNRDAYLGLERVEVQLARYPGGGARYQRHRDAFPGRSNRRVTAIYYVNPAWQPADGGLLRLYGLDGRRDVEPILDRLVLFLSERVEHEVLPTATPRMAVSAWFYGRGHVPL
jgi:SM-20-related protein